MAAKKQSNRRGTTKTTSRQKDKQKKNYEKTGSYQWIPDRDHSMDLLCC